MTHLKAIVFIMIGLAVIVLVVQNNAALSTSVKFRLNPYFFQEKTTSEITLYEVVIEVADALVAIEKLKDERAEKEAQVAALQNSSNLSRLRYDAGFSNYLEVLYADQQLFDVEIELARTRGAQLNGVVQLYRALGGGWQP